MKMTRTPRGRVRKNHGRGLRCFFRARIMLRIPTEKLQNKRVTHGMGNRLPGFFSEIEGGC